MEEHKIMILSLCLKVDGLFFESTNFFYVAAILNNLPTHQLVYFIVLMC